MTWPFYIQIYRQYFNFYDKTMSCIPFGPVAFKRLIFFTSSNISSSNTSIVDISSSACNKSLHNGITREGFIDFLFKSGMKLFVDYLRNPVLVFKSFALFISIFSIVFWCFLIVVIVWNMYYFYLLVRTVFVLLARSSKFHV